MLLSFQFSINLPKNVLLSGLSILISFKFGLAGGLSYLLLIIFSILILLSRFIFLLPLGPLTLTTLELSLLFHAYSFIFILQ